MAAKRKLSGAAHAWVLRVPHVLSCAPAGMATPERSADRTAADAIHPLRRISVRMLSPRNPRLYPSFAGFTLMGKQRLESSLIIRLY